MLYHTIERACVAFIYSSSGSGMAASSSHFIARWTARSQPWYRRSRSSLLTVGVKLSTPAVLTALSVSGFSRSQPKRPSVAPARRADPRAVDLFGRRYLSAVWMLKKARAATRSAYSLIWGRSTVSPRISACSCMQVSLFVIPPSTRRTLRLSKLASFLMESMIARVWKQVASSVARAM